MCISTKLKSFKKDRIKVIVVELSLDEEEMVQWICEGKSSSCAHSHTAQTTTPNLRIVDGAAANAAHRERRENEVD